MDTHEWKWATSGGLEMYAKAWVPTGKAHGVVCLVHGVGEHIGRYRVEAEALAAAGYVLAGFDLRGFGQSGGQRGHTPSLEAYFNDIDSFLAEIRRLYPELPHFLYGHSMGGVLVLAYTPVRQPKIAGVIATSPGLRTALEKQKFKVFLARLLGQMAPTLTLANGVDPKMLSRDPGVGEAYLRDPLVHDKVTTAWGKTMLGAIQVAFENAACFPVPLLLMHGTKDEIAYARGSQEFAALAPEDRVTLKLWDGFYHELHNDPAKNDVFAVMTGWLDQQTQNKTYS
jgi:alpha-beta hydrolase superfamily lysophospholipase